MFFKSSIYKSELLVRSPLAYSNDFGLIYIFYTYYSILFSSFIKLISYIFSRKPNRFNTLSVSTDLISNCFIKSLTSFKVSHISNEL
jgi:hypothetical protein